MGTSCSRQVRLLVCVVTCLASCNDTDRPPRSEPPQEVRPEPVDDAPEAATVSETDIADLDSDVWRLRTEPRMSLRAAAGAGGPVEWYDIRDVGRLSDGRVVVADGSLWVYVLDSDGRVVASFGGEGDGPAEFRDIGWLQVLAADLLLLYDPSRARASFFGSVGEYVRSVAFPGTDLRGRLEDGTFVSSWNLPVPRPGVGVYRERVVIRRHDADGDTIATIDTIPGGEAAVVPGRGGPTPAVFEPHVVGRFVVGMKESS